MNCFEKLSTFDWQQGCCIEFNPETGSSNQAPAGRRRLSEMRGMFCDDRAYEELVAREDRIVYEYHALDIPQTPGDLSFSFSTLYPGRVGNEYNFTKGHFHSIAGTAEIYFCTKGHGCLLIENRDGDCRTLELLPGRVGYVPKGYAHRSINISDRDPFITFFTYRADAGHDYATIEAKGFRKLLVEKNGIPTLVDNPKWLEL